MIVVNKVDTWGFEHAIRGMRNPMNSWGKSDSGWGLWTNDIDSFDIGQNDLALMKRLYKAGTEHRKYLRQIFVSMDITAPLYWWKEFDTYKIGTVSNSCSTMHKIAAKEFELDDFSHEHLDSAGLATLSTIIERMNISRKYYNGKYDNVISDDDKRDEKDYWWQMIQLLPSSYNQRRTITMNYENVVTIRHQRADHKLDEWKDFVFILTCLPYVLEITEGD